jgi:hypothetical protein
MGSSSNRIVSQVKYAVFAISCFPAYPVLMQIVWNLAFDHSTLITVGLDSHIRVHSWCPPPRAE